MALCTPGHEGHCWFAEGDISECKCECNGANHGMALEKNHRNYQEAEDYYKKEILLKEDTKQNQNTEAKARAKSQAVNKIADEISGGDEPE